MRLLPLLLLSSLPPLLSSFLFHPAPSQAPPLSMRKGGGRPRGPLRTFEVKPPMNEKLNFQEIRVVQPAESGNGKDEPVSSESAVGRGGERDRVMIYLRTQYVGHVKLYAKAEQSNPVPPTVCGSCSVCGRCKSSVCGTQFVCVTRV